MKKSDELFRVGSPISNPENFVGRVDIIKKIKRALLNQQNISLRGERRIGKTSLLQYISHDVFLKKYNISDNHLCVYFDFQEVINCSQKEIWYLIAKFISDKISQKFSDGKSLSEHFFSGFQQYFNSKETSGIYSQALKQGLNQIAFSGIKIHLLFDEFELTANNSDLGDKFYNSLRSLVSPHQYVSFIIATRTGISSLQKKTPISSPFYNIFKNKTLTLFSEDETKELITKYFKLQKIDEKYTTKLCNELPLLFRLTGYHPYFIQALCYNLCEDLTIKNWPKGKALKKAIKEFEEDSYPHFDYYWENSLPDEKEQLLLFAKTQYISKKNINIALLNKLENRGLILKEDKGYRLFSLIFQKWLKTFSKTVSIKPGVNYHSKWYIHRESEEEKALYYLSQSGKPVVLWGPTKIGKTMMLDYLLESIESKSNEQVSIIKVNTSTNEFFKDSDDYLRWIASQIVYVVKESEQCVVDAWKRETMVGNKITYLLEKYILTSNKKLIIIFDNADDNLKYSNNYEYSITNDFFDILRSWAEETEGVWQNLRIIMTISMPPALLTQKLNRSPFNLCDPIEVSDFTLLQLTKLANLYGIDLKQEHIKVIMKEIGGHPYLFSVLIDKLRIENIPITRELNTDIIISFLKDALPPRDKEIIDSLDIINKYNNLVNYNTLILKLFRDGLIINEKNDFFKIRYNIYEKLYEKEKCQNFEPKNSYKVSNDSANALQNLKSSKNYNLSKIIKIFSIIFIIISSIFLYYYTSNRQTKTIYFQTDPQNANVLINNKSRGKTPIEIQLLYGEYIVSLKLENYQPQTMELHVNSKTVNDFSAKLEQIE